MSKANYKLINVIESLQKDEQRKLGKYLQQSIGKDSTVYTLFKAITTKGLDLEDPKTIQFIKKKKFSDLSDKNFLNQLSRLTSYVEDYWVTQRVRQDDSLQKLLLIREYNDRGLYKYADRLYHTLETDLISRSDYNPVAQSNLRELYHLMYYSDNPIKYREGTELLIKLVTTYNACATSYGVQYNCELYNWNTLTNHDFTEQHQLLNRIIADQNISQSYKLLIRLVVDREYGVLEDILSFLRDGDLQKDAEMHTLLNLYGIVYGIRFVQEGFNSAKNTLVDLYDHAFISGAFQTQGKIPVNRLITAVGTYCTLRDRVFTDSFIMKWAAFVSEEKIRGADRFLSAIAAFYYGDYYDILPLMSAVSFSDINAKVRGQGFQLIGAYYERKDDPEIYTNIKANLKRTLFRCRGEINKNYYDAHHNLIVAIDQMVQKQEGGNPELSVSQFNVLFVRNWVEQEFKRLSD